MSQYVTIKIEFGGVEFADLFRSVIQKVPSIPKEIGSPSAFVFTAAGDVVYAGPVDAEGIKIDEDFKTLLISGIEKNGGLKVEFARSDSSQDRRLSASVGKIKSLLTEDKLAEAADMLSAILKESTAKAAGSGEDTDTDSDNADRLSDAQIEALKALTNLEPVSTSEENGAEQLVASTLKDMSVRFAALIASSAEGPQQATIAAVKMAELDRIFGSFPGASVYLGQAWKQLEEASEVSGIRKQGQEIDKARKFEDDYLFAEAIAAYKQVVSTFAGTPAAELSEKRITQLESRKIQPKREWKMGETAFSFSAILIKYDRDKKVVMLRSGDNNLELPLHTLSDDDREYVESSE